MTGVQTCALPILLIGADRAPEADAAALPGIVNAIWFAATPAAVADAAPLRFTDTAPPMVTIPATIVPAPPGIVGWIAATIGPAAVVTEIPGTISEIAEIGVPAPVLAPAPLGVTKTVGTTAGVPAALAAATPAKVSMIPLAGAPAAVIPAPPDIAGLTSATSGPAAAARAAPGSAKATVDDIDIRPAAEAAAIPATEIVTPLTPAVIPKRPTTEVLAVLWVHCAA